MSAYATSHLVAEAALPLTALLHCFDDVSGPWWARRAGGARAVGVSVGRTTAAKLGARVWIGAHDGGNRSVTGLVARVKRTRVYGRAEVEEAVMGRDILGCKSSAGVVDVHKGKAMTEVRALGVGEEVVVTSEGLCEIAEQASGVDELACADEGGIETEACQRYLTEFGGNTVGSMCRR